MTSISVYEEHFDPNFPEILPYDKMYNIQIGTKLFKISGASLSSDGPSYFTNYFMKLENNSNSNSNNNTPGNNNNMTTTTSVVSPSLAPSDLKRENDILFIDRSAEIFELIYKHLQGYFIDIKDEVQYTMLIADAVYYNLPRLKMLLKGSGYYYTRIGHKSFKFPKNLFSKEGDDLNYFQITFDTLYLDVERLIISKKLLRPPPHSYSFVARSHERFEDLLNLANGANLPLTEERRQTLIKECKFYRFLNLEQRLVKCNIDYNPITNIEEIHININYITQKGIIAKNNEEIQRNKVVNDLLNTLYCSNHEISNAIEQNILEDILYGKNFIEPEMKKQKINRDGELSQWGVIHYKRPFVDDYGRELNFQIDSKESMLIFDPDGENVYLDIFGTSINRFLVRMGLTLLRTQNIDINKYQIRNEDRGNSKLRSILPVCLSICDLIVDGKKYDGDLSEFFSNAKEDILIASGRDSIPLVKKGSTLYLSKSVWKVAFNSTTKKVVLVAVKLAAFRNMKQYCQEVAFL